MRDEVVVHGLTFVASGGRASLDTEKVTVVVAPATEPVPPPPHDAAMRCDLGERTLLYAVEEPDHWRLCYPGLLEAAVSPTGAEVAVSVQPEIDPEYVELMLVGSIAALIVTVRGDLALHASAVEFGAGVLAVAGASGQGKSTTAAMLNAAGCALFSDDTLRLDLSAPERIGAFRGTLEARLRPNAATVAAAVETDQPGRDTVDGRRAVALRASERSTAPLLGVVLPRPSSDVTDVRIEQLTGFDAFRELHACQRLIGWRHAGILRQNFDGICRLVETVPVLVAHIPWATGQPVEVGEDLRDALEGAVG